MAVCIKRIALADNAHIGNAVKSQNILKATAKIVIFRNKFVNLPS